MPQELLYLNQLLGNVGSGWLPAIMLGGILLALLFKPECVYSWPLFRFSCWFLGISIIITPMFNIGLNLMQVGPSSFGTSTAYSSELRFIIGSVYAIAPILQGISVICGLLSLIPTGYRPPLTPPKHPLE
jgi:hypothetical protein